MSDATAQVNAAVLQHT